MFSDFFLFRLPSQDIEHYCTAMQFSFVIFTAVWSVISIIEDILYFYVRYGIYFTSEIRLKVKYKDIKFLKNAVS